MTNTCKLFFGQGQIFTSKHTKYMNNTHAFGVYMYTYIHSYVHTHTCIPTSVHIAHSYAYTYTDTLMEYILNLTDLISLKNIKHNKDNLIL
jgi:hypothetical protein